MEMNVQKLLQEVMTVDIRYFVIAWFMILFRTNNSSSHQKHYWLCLYKSALTML